MKSWLFILGMLISFGAGAQIDLEGAAKKKLEQQDFNTTRNNKDRNSINSARKRSKKMSTGSGAPPPPPPAPAPDTLKDLLLQTDAFVAYKMVNSIEDFNLFVGRDFAIIGEPGKSQFTVYDFGRSRMISVDTVTRSYKFTEFEPRILNSNMTSATATGKSKVISGVQAAEYEVKDENETVRYKIWIDASEKLSVYWYDMTMDLIAENQVYEPLFFLNQGNLVLELQAFDQGQPLQSMKSTEMKKQVFTFDLRTFQRL